MNILRYIFPLYLILISCLPCADLEASSASYSSKEIATSRDNHSHDKDCDICSPFCACSCCGSPVFVFNSHYDFSSFKKTINTKVPEYQSELSCNYIGSIWQPPQINS